MQIVCLGQVLLMLDRQHWWTQSMRPRMVSTSGSLQCFDTVDLWQKQRPDSKNVIVGEEKGKLSIAADRLHDGRVRCSSPYHWSWASSGLAPGIVDGRPHLLHSLSLPLRLLHRYQIKLIGDRGTWVWTTCPESLCSSARLGIEPITSDRKSDARPFCNYATTGNKEGCIYYTCLTACFLGQPG